MMYCRKCSAEIPDTSAFCNRCGAAQTEKKRSPKRRGNGQGTVYRRGKTWQAEVTVGTLANGQRDRRFKGGFSTKRDALEYINTLRSTERKTGKAEAKTLEYYYESYANAEMLKLGKNTQSAYRTAWNKFESIKHVPVRDLSIVQIRDVVIDKAPTFDPASDMKSLLSHLLKLAIVDQEASINMSEYIPLPPKNESERTPWNEEEQKIIWQAYAEEDVVAAYLLLMIYTGMMPGEVFECTKGSINLAERTITKAGLKTKVRKSTPIVIADIIVPVIERILTYTADGEDQKIIYTDKWSFYGDYHAFTKKYGLRDLPPYSCRHTTATALALADVPPSVIQKVMRHSRFATTQHYIHPDSKDALEAVNRLSRK